MPGPNPICLLSKTGNQHLYRDTPWIMTICTKLMFVSSVEVLSTGGTTVCALSALSLKFRPHAM